MDKLLEILKSFNSSITPDMEKKLVMDGIIDSVDIVSLISEPEDEFAIEISMEDVVEDNFDTIPAMWAMIQRLQQE